MASPIAAFTRPNSKRGFRSSSFRSMRQPKPLPDDSNSSFTFVIPPFSRRLASPGTPQRQRATFTSGISTGPDLAAPTTLVAWRSAGSSGPEAMPSSWAASQLSNENMELVSRTATNGFLTWPNLACTAAPSKRPGREMPGRYTDPMPKSSAAFEMVPASLNRCSPRTRSRSRSKRARKGIPSMPCSVAPRAFSAMSDCTKEVTRQFSRSPMAFPPSKLTSFRVTCLAIGRPSSLHAEGVSTTSCTSAVEIKKLSGSLHDPKRSWATSKPLPNTSSGAGSVNSTWAATSSAFATGGGSLPLLLSRATEASSSPRRHAMCLASARMPRS
mmetsp:Transcript_46048/g.100011  ORF Transcript_46048/g.100011 Transcript_46048/m.100011 type:complete len:328 (-) Transcript_46048:437-1420(-)